MCLSLFVCVCVSTCNPLPATSLQLLPSVLVPHLHGTREQHRGVVTAINCNAARTRTCAHARPLITPPSRASLRRSPPLSPLPIRAALHTPPHPSLSAAMRGVPRTGSDTVTCETIHAHLPCLSCVFPLSFQLPHTHTHARATATASTASFGALTTSYLVQCPRRVSAAFSYASRECMFTCVCVRRLYCVYHLPVSVRLLSAPFPLRAAFPLYTPHAPAGQPHHARHGRLPFVGFVPPSLPRLARRVWCGVVWCGGGGGECVSAARSSLSSFPATRPPLLSPIPHSPLLLPLTPASSSPSPSSSSLCAVFLLVD